MKISCSLALFVLIAVSPAHAIVTLGQSNETFQLTGIGPNGAGQGQSNMQWGNCSYDGTNTNCTLSGTYTGFGNGGSYSFVLSYPGNGAFPLIAITAPGSNQFSAQAKGPYSLVITLTQNSGSPIHFYSFANFNFEYTGSATCTVVTGANCAVGQVGQTAGATIAGQIVGTFDPTPMIRTSQGVISAGGYGGFSSVAPATWIEIYGVNLATTLSHLWAGSDFQGTLAPTTLAGTTVTIAGLPAYVDYVSPGQVNAQVPSGVPTGNQPVVITTAGGTSAAFTVNVNATEPGLLAPSAFTINGNPYVVAMLSNTYTYILPTSVSGIQTARAKPGDNVTIYGIGFGPVTPAITAGQIVQQSNQLQASLQIMVGGVQAQVTYAGLAPNYVGLYQFNIVVPAIPASDTAPVAISLGGTAGTQKLVMSVGN